MSVCLESTNVLTNPVDTSMAQITHQPLLTNELAVTSTTSSPPLTEITTEQTIATTKSIAKLVVTNPVGNPVTSTQVLQKVVNPPLITVLNPAGGPLTVVKTLCVTSAISSAPQFTLVNSAPLNVTNAIGKSPTITLLNAPVTVVKAITAPSVEKGSDNCSNVAASASTNNISTIIENRAHNVFVKNTCPDSTVPDVPQSHKLLTANNFPQSNILTSITPNVAKTVNGQRSKLKILSNVVMASSSQNPNNMVLSKPSNPPQQQRIVPRQKVLSANNGPPPAKYVGKQPPPLPNNVLKTNLGPMKTFPEKSPPPHSTQQRMVYPTHKAQIKTIPPVNTYIQKMPGIKTLSPQTKNNVPAQVQRTGSGLRTIPPQRPPKLPNKPNYIGKHAVQAQKVKHPPKFKSMKQMPPYSSYHQPTPIHDKQMTFNQALTAEILETLSNKSGSSTYSPRNYDITPSRYENAFSYPEHKTATEPYKQYGGDKSKSGLDALSLICQAVLLDHNYNATLPSESPSRNVPVPNTPSQVNGISASSMYSPGSGRKRSLQSSNNTVSSSSSLSNLSMLPSKSSSMIGLQEDDAASDISECSDRKHDTEGEETDTAPEAEAVANDDHFDHYGDYVTRCICGYIHDDGYMVECDRCKVWQHVQCVVKNRQVPDEYLCEQCDPSKPVDCHKARLIQQQWLRDRQLPDTNKFKKDVKLKENFKQKHKDVLSDTESSDGEHTGHNNNNNTIVAKARSSAASKRKSDNHNKNVRQRRETAKEPIQRKQFKRRERKVVKRKTKVQSKTSHHSEDENQDTFSTTQLPQLRQWIENYEEAVTNHYSPELRARISSIRVNGAHSDLNVQLDSTVQKCRVHTQPLTDIKYLVSTVVLPPNTPVIELRGKYMLSTQHRNSGGALTTRQHAQRPGPFLFFYRLHKDNTEVCVDTRTYGNSARFIRRSCKPNAELRHCIEKGVLHLYIVTITAVEKNIELTIKHESHDLAAVGTTHIACYCGNSEQCTVNKTTIKKNGDTTEVHRKRRGRRTTSTTVHSEPETAPKVKEETPPVSQTPIDVKSEKLEVKPELEIKSEVEVEEKPIEVKEEVKEDLPDAVEEKPVDADTKENVKEEEEEESLKSPPPSTQITTRRSSHKAEKEEIKESNNIKQEKSKNKKLSREERKLEAILRAIEQMEKADQKKQEHRHTKQTHRRESEPGLNSKEDEKGVDSKPKRKRRKGRARTTSTHSRRVRLNSGDSYITSGDENMLSPNEGASSNHPTVPDNNNCDQSPRKDVGLLMAISNCESNTPTKSDKSPGQDDSNSNSAHSSPETPLSLACSLVQAAVEPLESGFKFPKTKKVLMNEWLNKVPETVQTTSTTTSPPITHINHCSDYESTTLYTPKHLSGIAQVNIADPNGRSSAKKRWLRQAISEDQCDSPLSRSESPPLSSTVAPPKKRRLPRESISNDTSPPSTPTGVSSTLTQRLNSHGQSQEGCVEIIYNAVDGDSPTQTLESDAILKERAAEMKQEFSKCILPAERPDIMPMGCLMDPRLNRDNHIFSNSEHLVGTVEKTLSILGFEDSKKAEPVTPAKRKLSITEYRQRKKMTFNENCEKVEESALEDSMMEENNSSESFKLSRTRSNSTVSSTSESTSDDENIPVEFPEKAPAFNSEPTELERQREISSLRLKKAFGLPIDTEPRKPTLNVEAILNCEIPPVIKPSIPLASPNYPIPGSCDRSRSPLARSSRSSSPTPLAEPLPPVSEPSPPPPLPSSPPPEEEAPLPPVPSILEAVVKERAAAVAAAETGGETTAEEVEKVEASEAKPENDETEDEDECPKPHMFYTPDEEEEQHSKGFAEIESVSYVPPFNNPVYPSANFTSVIDDESKYEGRNPSPPPSLDCLDDTHVT